MRHSYKLRERISKIFTVLVQLLLIVIFLFPFLWMVSLALQTMGESTSSPMVLIPAVPQWQNFVEAWNRANFAKYLENTIIVVVGVVALMSVVGIPAAYAFAKMEFKGKGLLFGLLMVAFMMPTQVTFIPIYYMMTDLGLIGTLLPQILPFMTNAFGIFLLRQYFMQVPDELLEAARLDNASEFKCIFKLMLPMSKSAITSVCLLSFVNHWNGYFWPLVMTRSDDIRPLTQGLQALKDTEGNDYWNIIMAGNMFLVLPIIVVYLFCSKYLINSMAYSGIK